MSIKFTDKAAIGKFKQTQEGYLVATARVARTGVQEYLAEEIGDAAYEAGFKSGDIVRVYRSPEEVFSKDSMNSLTRVPVTIGHPDVSVDAENWRDLAVGDVGDSVMRDGEWLVVNPMIKDSSGRDAARTTHPEISMGYQAGVRAFADKEIADLEMYNIRFNHLAQVPSARAGSQARIGDAQWGASPVTVKDNDMTVELRTVVLGDKKFSVEAKDADAVAAILQDHKTIVDAKDTEIGRLTAELKDAEAKVLTDAQIADMVAAKVEADKKLEAVRAKFGDEAVADASEAMIEGMYRVIDKAVDDTARNVMADKKQLKVDDADDKIKAAQQNFLNPERK